MNTFAKGLKIEGNFTQTENGAISYESTLNKVLDLFALGGAYRNRSDNDCVLLFKEAFDEDALLALKCLFYLRDCRNGQGERRFFRVCYNWLANNYPEIAKKNIKNIPEYGRVDDLYCMIDTPVQKYFLDYLEYHLLDELYHFKDISLIAKWMPSENASSKETKRLAKITREHFGWSARTYRKNLSRLRKEIKLLESLMSQNKWDEIDFSKIPSKAGIKYSDAFATREETKDRYYEFLKSKETKVNANVLYPHDIIRRAFKNGYEVGSPERLSLQKYWENLPDYYNGRNENAIAVIDVSGSMTGTPMEVAVSMGLYIAEKNKSPFANMFITFSQEPEIVNVKGIDIYEKVNNCRKADWGNNTDIEKVFDLLLNIAKRDNVKKEDIPDRVYIFSDMEFDQAVNEDYYITYSDTAEINGEVLFDEIARKWEEWGYKIPNLVFWNLNARSNQIPCIGEGISYVSGFSPSMIDCILGGKTGWELCLEKLNSERYNKITL